MEEKIKNDKPYDSAFKTVMKECRHIIFPLLNETFGKCCDKDDEILFLNDEHEKSGNDAKLISDANFIIRDNKGKIKGRYVYECQSYADQSMSVRMYKYGSKVAFENYWIEDGELHIPFPELAVLYLRGKGKDYVESSNIKIEYPDFTVDYEIKILRFKHYSIDELFEKQLYVLIPFTLFLYEDKLEKCNGNKEANDKLKATIKDIVIRLDEAETCGFLTVYEKVEILELLKHVSDSLAYKYDNVKKGVDEIMGGKVLEFDSTKKIKKIMNEGREEGREEGFVDGEAQGLSTGIRGAVTMMRKNKVPDHVILDMIKETYGLSDSEAGKYLS